MTPPVGKAVGAAADTPPKGTHSGRKIINGIAAYLVLIVLVLVVVRSCARSRQRTHGILTATDIAGTWVSDVHPGSELVFSTDRTMRFRNVPKALLDGGSDDGFDKKDGAFWNPPYVRETKTWAIDQADMTGGKDGSINFHDPKIAGTNQLLIDEQPNGVLVLYKSLGAPDANHQVGFIRRAGR